MGTRQDLALWLVYFSKKHNYSENQGDYFERGYFSDLVSSYITEGVYML